ncbi:hypothetical protein F1C58_07530 [Glaciihabitans sp. INWT7]|uniref:hypothetical protein n=1 Tax=Glaciihabitans sp. INWT7 TaxID=2596912 RepID=UPI00162A39B7|nr:hypothetical protein [Glaciihabitans sp. INWT7]QNE46767.1 hypothetical protein F1C58_07530 [Glaciihabitans sp. INWT7]
MSFLSDESRRALDSLETAAEPLDRLRAVRQAALALERDPAQLQAVRDSLDSGETWDRVADAAGLGVAAAKWRWQGTDEQIAERLAAGRKRSARPSSVPTGLVGESVADAARLLGVTAQAVYLRISRGTLTATTVTLDDGRSYKRVLL